MNINVIKKVTIIFTALFLRAVLASAYEGSLPCEVEAKEAARLVLEKEDSASGLNEATKPKYVRLKNGGTFVVSGWIKRVFDWEVIVVVDKSCQLQNTFLNPL